MAQGEIHIGDIGTAFTATIKDQDSTVVDISSASTKQILFRKPDGTLLTKSGVFVTDGTDGKLRYVSVSGDLDVKGTWQLQAYVVIGSNEWHSDIVSFEVYRNV